jgi:hypothetical protein
MNSTTTRRCDGCGQDACDEHFAKRLRRLEWATRFRPVHISVLFLGGAVPMDDADFLYAGAGEVAAGGSAKAFRGEGKEILAATGLASSLAEDAPSRAAALAEFQHLGYFLTHALECPMEATAPVNGMAELLRTQWPVAATRIRRSLKPRRIVLISRDLDAILPQIRASQLSAELLLDGEKAFALDRDTPAAGDALKRLEQILRDAGPKR